MDTLTLIIYIISMAWLANLITWRIEIPIWINFKNKYFSNYKILFCSTCFGFWSSLIINILLFNPVFGFFLSLVTSLIAAIIEKILFKW